MVRETSSGGRWHLPVRLLAVCLCWAVVALGALPSVAAAEEGEPGSCPGAPLEIPEEMAQPEREVRGLRNDLRAFCEAAIFEDRQVVGGLGELNSELQTVAEAQRETRDHVDQVAHALGAEGEVPIRVIGQSVPLETLLTNQAEDSSEGNFEGLEEVVLTSAETTNSDLWGLAGLFVGLLTLGVLYKIVRP